MPKCYQLIGVPGSGKSTWVDKQAWAFSCAKVSTDKWVEIYAKEVGRTYSEVFADFMPTAVDLMAKEVVVAREIGRDIIWDEKKKEKVLLEKGARSYFFNNRDYHGVDPEPVFRYTLRVDGTFTDELCKELGLENGYTWKWSYENA